MFSSYDPTTNQTIVSTVGGALEIRCGWVGTCREDVFPLFGATNWDRKKIIERGRVPWPKVTAV